MFRLGRVLTGHALLSSFVNVPLSSPAVLRASHVAFRFRHLTATPVMPPAPLPGIAHIPVSHPTHCALTPGGPPARLLGAATPGALPNLFPHIGAFRFDSARIRGSCGIKWNFPTRFWLGLRFRQSGPD